MQVSLVERKREREALLREMEILRALGHGPALPTRITRWVGAAKGRLTAMTRLQAQKSTAAPCRSELGSSGAA